MFGQTVLIRFMTVIRSGNYFKDYNKYNSKNAGFKKYYLCFLVFLLKSAFYSLFINYKIFKNVSLYLLQVFEEANVETRVDELLHLKRSIGNPHKKVTSEYKAEKIRHHREI